MKKTLLAVALLTATQSFAQPDIDGNNTQPIKLSDVVKAYHAHAAALPFEEEDPAKAKNVPEGKDYHFDRWLWYWQQHTDQNGNLVSPAKTWQEWQRYNKAAGMNKTTAANKSDWTFVGPSSSQSGYSGIGRINAMAFHPTNANIVWVGTAGGGVWTNAGGSWTCLTDKLPVLSVSDIDVNPLNPKTLYMCTGDRDGRDHYSIGILKTVDGGNTWNPVGLSWNASQFRLTNCLVINPKDTSSLTIATSEGIYKSFDAGANWTLTQSGNFKQVLYNPIDTNVLFATSFYTPANATDAQIFRSKNGGMTWQQITNLTGSYRITLGICEGNVKFVKAVAASYDPSSYRGLNGFYSSGDTGKSFALVFDGNGCSQNILSNNMYGSGCTGQGNYDLALAVNPADPNEIYVGGVNTWYTGDGGFSWQIVNQWYSQLPGVAEVHADKHFLGFHPLSPGRLYECNDGGIYWTDNPQSTLWNDISNGLGITQFYRNAVSNTANYVIGGAQDNGSKSITSTITDDVSGGDGMDCQIDPVDPNVYYTGVQYGKIYRTDGWQSDISSNIPGQPTGAWITPYIINPHNNNHLIAGYQDIYFSDDKGDSWMSLTQGPLVAANKNLLRLAMTPASASTIYAVADSSNDVYYTHSFVPSLPATFTKITPPFAGRISDIKVDAHNKDHFWITYSGFGSAQLVEYKSGNWTQINTNLPDVPIWCFEADSSNNIMYVGTDVGVFYLDTVNKQWEPYNTNLPSVHVCDLGINYTTNELWGATYGRSMWKTVKQEYGLGISIIPYASNAMQVYPNPAQGQFTINAKAFAGRKVRVRMIDYTGKTAWQAAYVFDRNGIIDIKTGTVPPGTYIVEAADDQDIKCRQKLVLY